MFGGDVPTKGGYKNLLGAVARLDPGSRMTQLKGHLARSDGSDQSTIVLLYQA